MTTQRLSRRNFWRCQSLVVSPLGLRVKLATERCKEIINEKLAEIAFPVHLLLAVESIRD